ncbi:Bacterial domain of uncharacterised function (DUF1798) [Staphylococcus carnosus]|uniref:DUF1798 family protein n=3 Tax=Staphylococcus carnosus TaxID=1281 RepID=B9DNW2_STACT|nr:conserved hypothetical protein [Staphylococcus carnosus subsp. carnosus TM300]SUL90548.1 Bacterial domain of uncharacterised function (DUF1798) [Staphylococcus carnosus]SUM06392.1 Bacterial domain of uncharacterised function (DUF1798) [Staphylococcus carnosus]
MMYNIIQQLIRYTQMMKERYQKAREGVQYSFHNDVVPFTKEIDTLIDKLNSKEEHVVSLPYMNKMKYQILIQNLETLSVECHYSSTSRKIFMDKLKSVKYDLNYIKESETKYG